MVMVMSVDDLNMGGRGGRRKEWREVGSEKTIAIRSIDSHSHGHGNGTDRR